MSKNIDERVVEMRFDNKHFEDNVQETMSTIDKLKKKLNFTGATKGLEDIGDSAKKVNMTPLANAAETVRLKFSALEVMAVTALQNITNTALNAGKRIVSALTIDPIKTGFQEYETQINSVQTILANTESKGTTLDDVNRALDELNTYADRTIYNFTQMTRNIGTFTAAGVDLETSVAAIKGIANLAAISGSTSQQASTAMYQLSQALSAGTVKLMDWNSVVNAGMGGQVFQDALKETARVHGIAIDEMIKNEGSFRNTLSNGWLSSEILTETLSKFTGDLTEAQLKTMGYNEEQIAGILKMGKTANDAATKVKTFTQLFDTMKEAAQSGWSQTWKILIGDFEEARTLFTEISDAFGALIGGAAESRNNLLKGAFSSKWSQLEEQITKAGIPFDDFQKKLIETAKSHGVAIDLMIEKEGSFEKTLKHGWLTSGMISETLREYTTEFGATNAELDAITQGLTQFGDVVDQVIVGNFGNGAERIKLLTDAGYDYATIQDLVNKVLNGTVDELEKLSAEQLKNLGFTEEQISAIQLLSEEAEKSGTSINKLISDLDKPSGRELLIDTFRNALKGLWQIISSVREAWRDAFPPMTAEQLYKIVETIHSLSKHLVFTEKDTDKLTRTFKGLFAIIDVITTFTGGAFKAALKLIGRLFGLVDMPVLDLTAHIGDMAVKFRDWLLTNNIFAKGFNKLVDCIANGATTVKDWFVHFMSLPETQARFERFKQSITKGLTKFNTLLSKGGRALRNYGKNLVEGVKKARAWFDEFRSLPDTQAKLEKFKTVLTNALTSFGALIQNGVNRLKEFGKKIVEVVKKVKDWIDEFKSIPAVQKALDNFKTGVGNVFNAIKDALDNCKKSCGEFFDTIKSLDSLTFEDLLTAVKGLKDKIVQHFATIGEPFNDIPKALDSLGEEVKIKLGETWKGFDKFLANIQYFATSIKDRIGNIDLGGIILAALGIGTLTVGSKIGDALDALTAPLSGFGELLKGLATQTRTVSGLLKAVKFTVLASGFVALAAGILILAGAAALLTLVDQKKLWSAVGALAVLGVVLIGVSAGMVAINKGISNIVDNTTAILMLAGSVLVLAIALRMITKMNPSTLVSSVVVLVTVMGALLAASIALSKITPKLFAGSISLIGLAVAVTILVSALKDITKINGNKVYESLIVLVGTMAALAIVSEMAKGVDKWGAVSALAAAIALKVLVGAIEDYSTMKLETILSALVSMVPILGMLALVMYSTKYAGQHAAKAGVAMLAISAALIFMVTAIKQLAKVSPSSLVAPLVVISVLMALIAGVVAVSKFAGKHAVKAGVMLLMMAGALVIVSLITAILGKMDPDGLLRGAAAITALMACFAGLIFITKYAKALKGVQGVLITFTVAIALLGVALAVLSSMDVENVLAATIAMTSVMGMLVILMKTVSTLKNLGKKALPTIVLLTAVVAAMGGILYLLGDLEPESTLATAAGLSALLLSLSASCKILSTIKTFSGPALANAAILTAIVAALGGILYLLKDLDPVTTLAVATGLSALILSLSGTCVILSAAGAAAQPALVGIGILAALIVALGALMAAIGALVSEFPQINEWLDSAILVFEKIGYGLGSFVGSIIGGLAAGAMSGLPAIADSISQFMTNLKPFFDGLKEVSSETLGAANNLVEIVLLMTAANLINGISSFLLGDRDMNAFAEQLVALGAGIVGFSTIVDGNVDADAVETAANAGKMLTALADTVPNTGGLLGFIVGNNDIGPFATQLPVLAEGIVAFSAIVKGNVDADAVETAANAGKMLTALADTVPNTGGLLGFIVGNNDIGPFASQLPTLAEGIVAFSAIVNGNVDKDAVETAKNAGLMLTELADTVPNTGGLLGFIVGNNDIGLFATQLPTLAEGIVAFSAIVNGNVDKDAVETAKNAGLMLTELADTVPNTGGLLDYIVGGNDIDKFAIKLPVLAGGIVAFSAIVDGNVDKDAVETAKNAGLMLTELADKIPRTGGLLELVTGKTDVAKFSTQLPLLGLGIASFAAIVTGKDANGQAVAKVDKDAVEAAANAGSVLADLTTKVNASSLGGLLSFMGTINAAAFLAQMPLLGQGIVAFANAVSGIDTDSVEAAASAGEMLSTLSEHVTENTGNWLYNLFGGDNNKFKNFKTQMKSLGEAIVEFAKAIDGKIKSTAVTAATRVGEILATLMEKMKNSDIKQMDNFNKKLSDFGETLLDFYTDLTEIDMTVLNNIMTTLNSAVDDMHGWVADADTTKMSTFTTRLSTLGTKLKGFYRDLTDIKLDAFMAALDVVDRLVKLTMDMSEVDADGVNAFGASLTSLGATGVTRFVKAFKDGEAEIKAAANNMMTTFSQTISDKTNTTKLTTEFGSIIKLMLDMINGASEVGEKYRKRFEKAGVTIITNLTAGISGETSLTNIQNAISKVINTVLEKLEHSNTLESFKDAGIYLAKGFASGISSMVDHAADKARSLARAAANAIEDELDIRSPSRVLYKDGEFSGMGFVNALADYADRSYDAGANLADSARMGLRKAIAKVVDTLDSDLDTDPVIRPVLDLTNVESGARRLNTMFARTQVMSIDIGNRHVSDEDQNGDAVGGRRGNVYNYTQNNYSPKALSRLDIYRQTKNQFSAMERMVEDHG